MKAMILAAGLGSRLKEETIGKPKALVHVGGKTLLQHVLEKLKKEGFSEVVVNVHHFSALIKDFIETNDFGIPVYISDETDKLLDTGGGLKKAAPYFSGNDPVLIHNVDVLSDLNLNALVKDHLCSGALATLVVRKRKTYRYFRFNREKRLVGWINKKTGETKIAVPGEFKNAIEMAFSGIHIINPDIFQMMPDDDRFSITDLYLQLAGKHFIKGYFDESEWWLDVGKIDKLAEARRLFRS